MINTMMINGYKAVIAYDSDIELFRGEFIGLNGGADFYGSDVESLRKEGAESLKVFLEVCKENGIEPKKQYSGRFNVRINPKLHEDAMAAAIAQGISLNELVRRAIATKAHR